MEVIRFHWTAKWQQPCQNLLHSISGKHIRVSTIKPHRMRFRLSTTVTLLKRICAHPHTLTPEQTHKYPHLQRHIHTRILGSFFPGMLTFSLTFKAKFGCLDIVLPLKDFNNRKTNGFYKQTHSPTLTQLYTHTQEGRIQISGCFIFLCFGCLTLATLHFCVSMLGRYVHFHKNT